MGERMKRINIQAAGVKTELTLIAYSFSGDKNDQKHRLIFEGETWLVTGCVLPSDRPPDALYEDHPVPPPALAEYLRNPDLLTTRDFWAIYKRDGKEQRFNCEVRVVPHSVAEATLANQAKTDTATVIRRELAPVTEAMKDTSKSVREVGQREAELTRKVNDVAPQAAADRSKAIVAWMKQLQFGCSEIEKKAAIFRIEGMKLSEIAKRLPHKNGKAMTREGVRQALLRFETKSGERGLFSKGTYRKNKQIESDVGRAGNGVYWQNVEEANKPDEDGKGLVDT